MPTVRDTPDAVLAAFAAKGMFPTGLTATPLSSRQTSTIAPSKPSKYRNRKTVIDDWTFDSQKEARRYLDLRAEQNDGRITELRCQEPIPLVVNGQTVGVYIADFSYRRDGERVIEDVKSTITRRLAVYQLKRKILAANGIIVQEK